MKAIVSSGQTVGYVYPNILHVRDVGLTGQQDEEIWRGDSRRSALQHPAFDALHIVAFIGHETIREFMMNLITHGTTEAPDHQHHPHARRQTARPLTAADRP